MGEAIKKEELKFEITSKENSKKIKEQILETHTDELIIGFCGPIGTDISFVSESFKKILENNFGYECIQIKLSTFIKNHGKCYTTKEENGYLKYYQDLIDTGNKLRNEYGYGILSALAINEITVKRETLRDSESDYKLKRKCFLIDSFKNIEEIELFRLVYNNLFYFFGVFTPIEKRIKRLEDKGIKKDEIYKLIDRDSGEEVPNGQKVTDTFIEADFFLRIDNLSHNVFEDKIKRYIDLIFASEIITPTSDEAAMYLATSASGNSACLSRQVGASITDSSGNLLSVGWNDVPKFGGSVYREVDDKKNDNRCMNIEGGICFNDREKDFIAKTLVDELLKENLIDKSKSDDTKKIIIKSKIKELIEFSRAVHAEMLAIISGSQESGRRMIGGKLYCTTYPCHNCARHIVAAGISEVQYIEPYRKSLAIKLHSDSITEDENSKNKLKVLMFEGVSPKRYLEFFKMKPNSRKKEGKLIVKQTKNLYPKSTISLHAIPLLEKKITEDLISKKLLIHD